MSGVPELRDLPGHRAGPDEPPALAAAAPGLGLPQPRLQAERPAAPVPVQARGGHGLQLQPGGAAGHGDGGAAEAAVGALLPLPPPLPVAAAGPARHAALRRAAAAGGEAGRDLPDAGGHRVQVLQCQTLHHGQYSVQMLDTRHLFLAATFPGQRRHPGLGGAAGGLVSSGPRHAVVRDCQNAPGGWRPVLANLANLRLAALPPAGGGAAQGARAGVGGAAPGGGARPAAGGRQVVRHGALHGDRLLTIYSFHTNIQF